MPNPIATVEVPASSANLGSGFDCFAAALSLKLRAELFAGDEPGIVLNAHGEGAPGPDADPEENLLIRAFREGLRAAHGSAGGAGSWRIEVSSMIPAARGLGSSGAAIVAGLLIGAAVGRHSPTADELLTLAATLEGHPDNVSAALYGGITLAVERGMGEPPLLRRFRVPEAWIPVAFVAATSSRTASMRSVLPPSVPHHDAAAAAARAALLATAIVTSDAGLLRTAMDDRLHQPYRLPLLPHAANLISTAYEHGASGAALSGAGPSVIAICDSAVTAHSVEKAWTASGAAGMATRLRFDTTGARLSVGGTDR
ncbi:MAG: homoserine kinase [Chloroflexota bacterium]|nr:homoserine kinase [Chloroflexota bacterium]